MEILFHSHLDSNTVIATKFCTWHDSCAVMACAKICCDLMSGNGITARPSFYRIWIAGKKSGPRFSWIIATWPAYFNKLIETLIQGTSYGNFLFQGIRVTLHDHHGTSNHWQYYFLLSSLFRQRKYQGSALLALCEGNRLMTGGFPSQVASNVESVLISWHLHEKFSDT